MFDWGVYDLSFHLGVLGDRPDLERIEGVMMKDGLDGVDPGAETYDVEEHFVVNMILTGNISYCWERGAHANVAVPNETRIFGTRGGIKLAYCTWDDPRITVYDLDPSGKARERCEEVDMTGHLHDGYALVDHFIRVMDGNETPVISLEQAKKHMEMILKCRDFAYKSV